MTQFKAGDRVKIAKEGWYTKGEYGFSIGDKAVVVDASRCKSIEILMDNPQDGMTNIFVEDAELELASMIPTPPATIQHEGYNYTRGEPVVPEWVKDGAWVVDTLTDQLAYIEKNPLHGGWIAKLPGGSMFAAVPYFSDQKVSRVFRPFTNEDWKWGMWAEYKGEKVFVMSGKDGGGVFASRPTNTYFFALFSEITPTTAP